MADLMADHQREASSPILTTEPLDLLIGDINNLNGGDKRKKNIKTNNCTTVHLDPKQKTSRCTPAELFWKHIQHTSVKASNRSETSIIPGVADPLPQKGFSTEPYYNTFKAVSKMEFTP